MLFKFGVDVSLKIDWDEVMLLYMVVSLNSYYVVFMLLKYGCDLEVINLLGWIVNLMWY